MPVGVYYGDFDALVEPGIYRVGTNENMPADLHFSQVIVGRGTQSDTVGQIGLPYTDAGHVLYRGGVISNGVATWGAWKVFATATPPAVYDLPLANGLHAIEGYGVAKYWKTQENIVHFTAYISKDGTNSIPNGSGLWDFPVGFRPAAGTFSSANLVAQKADFTPMRGVLTIHNYGTAQMFLPVNESVESISVSGSFVAGG